MTYVVVDVAKVDELLNLSQIASFGLHFDTKII